MIYRCICSNNKKKKAGTVDCDFLLKAYKKIKMLNVVCTTILQTALCFLLVKEQVFFFLEDDQGCRILKVRNSGLLKICKSQICSALNSNPKQKRKKS